MTRPCLCFVLFHGNKYACSPLSNIYSIRSNRLWHRLLSFMRKHVVCISKARRFVFKLRQLDRARWYCVSFTPVIGRRAFVQSSFLLACDWLAVRLPFSASVTRQQMAASTASVRQYSWTREVAIHFTDGRWRKNAARGLDDHEKIRTCLRPGLFENLQTGLFNESGRTVVDRPMHPGLWVFVWEERKRRIPSRLS